MKTALPLSLLALLFASPILSLAASNDGYSPNDPFRALALQKPKQPENPICCLTPLTPPEPVDDGMLLSFEEWKMKQLASEAVAPPKLDENHTASVDDPVNPNDRSVGGSTDTPTPAEDTPAVPGERNGASDLLLSGPQFRVPLTDRFNYASLDCSARVHTAHRSAKSPSSILSSKRDRYMLSPCSDKTPNEKQFVVVELCDDIRIDTVQLANFEFFSGVFKDFTVSVSKTYTIDPDDWTVVSTYRAKNVRGVQSFRWPTSLRDFYRFIRIDFLSHYGNEYYCPVSLLRVYGLTHLEEWKWEVWEAESRSKQAEIQRSRLLTLPAETPVAVVAPTVVVESVGVSSETQGARTQNTVSSQNELSEIKIHESDTSTSTDDPISSQASSPTPASPSDTKHHSTDTHASPSSASSSASLSISQQSIPPQNNIPTPVSPSASISTSTPAQTASPTAPNLSSSSLSSAASASASPSLSVSTVSPSSQPSVQAASSSSSTSLSSSSSSGVVSSNGSISIPTPTPTPTIVVSLPSPSVAPPVQSQQQLAQQQPPSPREAPVSMSLAPSAASTPISPSAQPPPPPPPPSVQPSIQPPIPPPPPPLPPQPKTGESIYRTILNKLAEIEANQTLYVRYVEQQHGKVREVMRRLGEDVGRLEGVTRAQNTKYQRTMDDWDRQRYQLEMEYGELISRIEYLSEEITLEKRLGVAQLLLLLAVLVFMGLTRGSRAESVPASVVSPADAHSHPLAHSRRSRFREWGRRHLRLSGDWEWDWDWGFRPRTKSMELNLDANLNLKSKRGESGSGSETSRSRTRSGTETAGVPPRTPSPARDHNGTAKRMNSGRRYPPRLPLDSRFSYNDDDDDNEVQYPSTSQPYISTAKSKSTRRQNQNQNQPLTPISLNALPTAPASISLNLSHSHPQSSSSRSENRTSSHSSHSYTQTQRQRTTSNPRSRAPSLRSTPRRGQGYPYVRPVTPTSATFLREHPHPHPHQHQALPLKPQMLQRSSSHGMGGVGMLPSASWGSGSGSGLGSANANVPKSARKWARTAHLHEVKTLSTGAGGVKARKEEREVVVVRNGEPDKDKGKGKEKEKETGAEQDKVDVFTSSSSPSSSALQPAFGAEAEAETVHPAPLNSLLLMPDESNSISSADEDGDTWVDTDSVGGSELDADVDVEMDERHFAGGASSSASGSSPGRPKVILAGGGGEGLMKPPLIPFPSA